MRKILTILLFILQFTFSPWVSSRLILAYEIPEVPDKPSKDEAPSAPDVPEKPSTPEKPSIPEESEDNDHETTENTAPTPPEKTEKPSKSDAPQPEITSDEPTDPGAAGSQETNENNTDSLESDSGDQNSDLNASNSSTGSDSENTTSVSENSEVDVNQENDADVDNKLVLVSDSGGNSSDKNTGDGKVTSGDANVNALVENDVNSNSAITGEDTSKSVSQSATNQTTGSGSNNNSETDLNNETLVESSNTAELDNGVIAIADSGGNTASKNTGKGEVVSGDANVGVTVVNVANTNISGVKTSEFYVYYDHNGDIIVGADQNSANSNTGSDSNNKASDTSNTSLTIVNDNDAKVANDLVIDATTGHNSADKNTGDGKVETGDANVVANVVNLVNNNLSAGTEILVATVNVFGNLVGNIILDPLMGSTDSVASNSNTGAESNNQVSVAQSRIMEVAQKNEANINNSMVINANTGGNNADKNTGESDVQTGDVNVQAQETTVANNNMVGSGEDTWWIVVVNEAGKWVGKIMGADEGENVAVVDSIDLGAVNSKTGSDSENIASSEQNSETRIKQTNKAEVNNNVVINADTGHNSAEKNTGNSSIETGDVNVYSNVVNYVNNNISGGKVVVAFVNVFGSWIGDLVTPGNESDNEVSESNEVAEVDENPVELSDSNEDYSNKEIGGSVENSNSEDSDNNSSESQIVKNEDVQEDVGSDEAALVGEVLAASNWVRRYSSTSNVDDDRVEAGIWLVEEDEFLQTTPTPILLADENQEGNSQTDEEQKLVWLLLATGPLGWGAWFLKKKMYFKKLFSR